MTTMTTSVWMSTTNFSEREGLPSLCYNAREVIKVHEDVKKKIQNMIETAETDMEREFWQEAEKLFHIFEGMSDDEAIHISRDGESLYLWKGEHSVQFVNTEEKKVGSKDLGEALVLAVLFIRDGDSVVSMVPKSQALQKKLEVMMG